MRIVRLASPAVSCTGYTVRSVWIGEPLGLPADAAAQPAAATRTRGAATRRRTDIRARSRRRNELLLWPPTPRQCRARQPPDGRLPRLPNEEPADTVAD